MNAQKAEHWLRSAEADIPDGSRSLDLRAGIALLPELKKLRQAQATINEQSNTIAELEAERDSLQNGYDLAMSKLDPPLLSDLEAVQKMFRTLAAKPESGWTYQLSLALEDGFRFYDMVVADVGHSDKNYVFKCDGLESLLKKKAALAAAKKEAGR